MAKKINGQDFPPRKINGHDFSKHFSKEKSPSKQGEASFRLLYYGGAAGSVPFMWESQPGTPKHPLSGAAPPPPLTPPPSYQSSSPRSTPLLRKHSKNSRFFNSIFPRVKIGASPISPPATSSSSSSSFSSSYSLPTTPFRKSGDFRARSRSAVRFGLDEEGEYDDRAVGIDSINSPTSTLCFGPRNGRRFRGVKKVVLSIVGHRSGN